MLSEEITKIQPKEQILWSFSRISQKQNMYSNRFKETFLWRPSFTLWIVPKINLVLLILSLETPLTESQFSLHCLIWKIISMDLKIIKMQILTAICYNKFALHKTNGNFTRISAKQLLMSIFSILKIVLSLPFYVFLK